MKVIDFSGREYSWPPSGHVIQLDDKRKRSAYHLRVRHILSLLYPLNNVLEEVPATGTGLFLDFYIPHLGVAIEVHGEQHYKYIPMFHGSPLGFLASKTRDRKKKEWCELNGIALVELSYADTDDRWREQINDRSTEPTEDGDEG